MPFADPVMDAGQPCLEICEDEMDDLPLDARAAGLRMPVGRHSDLTGYSPLATSPGNRALETTFRPRVLFR